MTDEPNWKYAKGHSPKERDAQAAKKIQESQRWANEFVKHSAEERERLNREDGWIWGEENPKTPYQKFLEKHKKIIYGTLIFLAVYNILRFINW